MRKKLLTLAFAALTVGLLGSCSKINERIDGLDKRVYDLENNQIASIEQQITAINQSITDLKAADETIGGKIGDLKTTAEALQTLIDALKEADKALVQKDEALEARIATLEGQVEVINGQIKTLEEADKAINARIDELKSYIDTKLGEAKGWALDTFATLEEYRKTAAELATLSVTVSGISNTLAAVQASITTLDAKIEGINAALQGKIEEAKTELEGKIADLKTELEGKIADAIKTSEDNLKGWVNKQLEGYYTIAQIDVKIAGLQSTIDILNAGNVENKAKIAELEANLNNLRAELEDAKATIKAEYEAAIKQAIEGNDGYITETIKNAINQANGKIDALTGRVNALEETVAALRVDVEALKAMIQTVSIIPAYNDGSLKAEGGILTINCVITPKEAVDGLTKENFTVFTSEVLTKAGLYGTIAIANNEDLVLDKENGTATLKVDISAVLPTEEGKALTVALNVKNGISDFTTDFVPVYVAAAPGPVLPDGALAGEFTVAEGKKVHFSQGNLTYNVSTTTWAFYEHQYDCATGYDSNLISLFTWGYGTWSTSPNGTDYQTGDFTDWGSQIGDGNTWRTLTTAEWQYLFNNHTKKWATVNGVNGYVIAPDDFSGELANTYADDAALAANNLVFLPAAGDRLGSYVGNVGDNGFYWSSTASDERYAFSVIFDGSDVSPDDHVSRNFGFSVRLITESK